MKETSDKVFDTDTIIAESGKPLTSEQKKYLELLGAYNLDTQFNQAVQRYDSQLKVQAQLLQIQSDVASLGSANQMAETSRGLGTGAQGVQAAQFQYAVQDQNAALQAQIEESRTEFLTNLAENYASQLSALLGEQDENGNFTNILQYEATTDYFLDSLQEEMVYRLTGGTMTDANGNEITDYQRYLVQQGILVQTDDGNYETTELGDIYLEQIINGNNITVDPETGQAVDLTTERLVENMAESWAMSEYGANTWAMMDYDAQEKAIAKYKDQTIQWLMDNNMYVRYTHLDMGENIDEAFSFNNMYAPPEANYANLSGEILTLSQVQTSYPEYYKTNHEYQNDEFVVIEDSYYIYSNGNFYKTTFTKSNPPDIVSVDTANVTSFGYFNDTGTGKGSQDEWVQSVIDAAKDGRIEDYTIIDFNFGFAEGQASIGRFFKKMLNKETAQNGTYLYYDGDFYNIQGMTSADVEKKFNISLDRDQYGTLTGIDSQIDMEGW